LSVAVSQIFLFVVTILISLPGALYFGEDGSDLVTLNFQSWTGKGFVGEQPMVAAVFSYIIRVLPPIYVLTAIPINGLTMSVNLMEIFPEKLKVNKYFKIGVKLLCVIPPIVLGGFSRCLGVIIEFTGLMGFIIMLAPAVLLLASKK
jgi:hypothetical protein